MEWISVWYKAFTQAVPNFSEEVEVKSEEYRVRKKEGISRFYLSGFSLLAFYFSLPFSVGPELYVKKVKEESPNSLGRRKAAGGAMIQTAITLVWLGSGRRGARYR